VGPFTRHLISVDDLTETQLRQVVARGASFSQAASPPGQSLAGQVVGVYFSKTSTRTRTAFATAALRLGAQIVAYGPADLQTNTGETMADTGRVLSGMLDAIVARTAGDVADLRDWASHGRMSVINAMTSDEHPSQALADLTTLQRRFGRIDDLRMLYVGEGNNTAAALALAFARFPGACLELRTPPGYGIGMKVRERVALRAQASGAHVAERSDLARLPTGIDVIYTTRWQTTGTAKADPRWREVFEPFRVTTRLWESSPDALFMHDLPAHRGEEVTAEVLDGPMSIAFEQAANKMYSAMAVLEWCRAEREG
jgi:ornithine carbamoyltransferase